MWNCSCQKKNKKNKISQKNTSFVSEAIQSQSKNKTNEVDKKYINAKKINNNKRQEHFPVSSESKKENEEGIFSDDQTKKKFEIEEHIKACRISPLSKSEGKKFTIFKTDFLKEKLENFM